MMNDLIQTRDIVLCEDHIDESLTDDCLYCRIAELQADNRRRGSQEYFLEWRQMAVGCGQGAVVCAECSGAGRKLYGSTATWRGGIGGQAFTTDVCDKCWGSGYEDRPWPSHRRIAELEAESNRLQGIVKEALSEIEKYCNDNDYSTYDCLARVHDILGALQQQEDG